MRSICVKIVISSIQTKIKQHMYFPLQCKHDNSYSISTVFGWHKKRLEQNKNKIISIKIRNLLHLIYSVVKFSYSAAKSILKMHSKKTFILAFSQQKWGYNDEVWLIMKSRIARMWDTILAFDRDRHLGSWPIRSEVQISNRVHYCLSHFNFCLTSCLTQWLKQ